jgi:hypothetical protein
MHNEIDPLECDPISSCRWVQIWRDSGACVSYLSAKFGGKYIEPGCVDDWNGNLKQRSTLRISIIVSDMLGWERRLNDDRKFHGKLWFVVSIINIWNRQRRKFRLQLTVVLRHANSWWAKLIGCCWWRKLHQVYDRFSFSPNSLFSIASFLSVEWNLRCIRRLRRWLIIQWYVSTTPLDFMILVQCTLTSPCNIVMLFRITLWLW